MSNKATLIMLIGLPASGKSTWSERYIRDKPETVLHSSDAIRTRQIMQKSLRN